MASKSTCDDVLAQIEEWNREDDNAQAAWQRNSDAYNAAVSLKGQWDDCRNNLNCYGNYAGYADKVNSLRNERRAWNNCVAWNETSAGKHNDWCANDRGQDWQHVGQEGSCSLGFGKGVCGRNDNAVKRDLGLPSAPGVPPHPGPQPSRHNMNVQCCQSFTAQGIQAKNVSFNEINQTCSTAPAPAPVTKPAPVNKPILPVNKPTTAPVNKPATSLTTQSKTVLALIIIAIIIVILSSSSSLLLLMSSKNSSTT